RTWHYGIRGSDWSASRCTRATQRTRRCCAFGRASLRSCCATGWRETRPRRCALDLPTIGLKANLAESITQNPERAEVWPVVRYGTAVSATRHGNCFIVVATVRPGTKGCSVPDPSPSPPHDVGTGSQAPHLAGLFFGRGDA